MTLLNDKKFRISKIFNIKLSMSTIEYNVSTIESNVVRCEYNVVRCEYATSIPTVINLNNH